MKRKIKDISGLGKLLQSARNKGGLSQRGLAEKIGVSAGQVAKFETGERIPDKDLLDKIRDLFDLPIDYFFAKKNSLEIEAMYEAYIKDFDAVRKLKLDAEQMTALHWVLKRILLEVSMDNVRSGRNEK